MTEKEWRECADPDPMFEICGVTVFDVQPGRFLWRLLGVGPKKKAPPFQRKLRFFCAACCRRVWDILEHHSRSAVEEAERFADGLLNERELEVTYFTARAAHYAAVKKLNVDPPMPADDLWDATQAVLLSCSASPDMKWVASAVSRHAARAIAYATRNPFDSPGWRVAWTAERAHQAKLMRHVFDNPYRQPTSLPRRLPQPSTQLAEALYAGEDCSFALRDALLESGHTELADHFKDKDHPKGCWALDLILGKK
jgi:hypothetical protein